MLPCTPTTDVLTKSYAGFRAVITIPWHRVVNASGEVSVRGGGDSHELQGHLLEAEEIRFDERGRIDLKKHRWTAA